MHNPPGTGTLKLRGDEYSEINELKKVFLLLLLFISRIIRYLMYSNIQCTILMRIFTSLHSTRFTFCMLHTSWILFLFAYSFYLLFLFSILHYIQILYSPFISNFLIARVRGEFEGKRKKSICRVNRYNTKWWKKRKGGTSEGRKEKRRKEKKKRTGRWKGKTQKCEISLSGSFVSGRARGGGRDGMESKNRGGLR